MKNLMTIVSKVFVTAMMLGITTATTGIAMKAAPARAASLSFVGSFAPTTPNQLFSLTFTTTSSSLVNFRSYGYDGGTNATGATISAGGFDPILTVFDNPTGNFIFEQNGTDTGATDFNVDRTLAAGDYRVVISAFANFLNQQPNPLVPRNIADGFENEGDFFGREPDYAFDINNVNLVSTTAVPEPSDFIGTVVAGFGVVMFKRKFSSIKKQN
ncbi:DVUA0089 family protein [Chamaesiphon sp.]|uniref:DVUA0089 family protein n=1 Tax=Chamaesiphon sp. TaxID=2814140 RepID=UPI00359322D4